MRITAAGVPEFRYALARVSRVYPLAVVIAGNADESDSIVIRKNHRALTSLDSCLSLSLTLSLSLSLSFSLP